MVPLKSTVPAKMKPPKAAQPGCFSCFCVPTGVGNKSASANAKMVPINVVKNEMISNDTQENEEEFRIERKNRR